MGILRIQFWKCKTTETEDICIHHTSNFLRVSGTMLVGYFKQEQKQIFSNKSNHQNGTLTPKIINIEFFNDTEMHNLDGNVGPIQNLSVAVIYKLRKH